MAKRPQHPGFDRRVLAGQIYRSESGRCDRPRLRPARNLPAKEGTYPDLSSPETNRLKRNLVWNKVTFSGLGFTLFVCQFEVRRNPLLKQRFIAFNQALAEYCKIGLRASRKVRGFRWENGEKVPTAKHGGIYRKPE